MSDQKNNPFFTNLSNSLFTMSQPQSPVTQANTEQTQPNSAIPLLQDKNTTSQSIQPGFNPSTFTSLGFSIPNQNNTANTPAFGTTTAQQTTTPAFGSTAAQQTTTPIFGSTTAPSFGNTNTGLFGTTNTPFGTTTTQQTTTPAFGSTTAPSFSTTTTQQTNTPAFGSTTTPAFGSTTASSFGTTTTQQTNTPSFGNTTTQQTTTPAFGSTTSSTPAFGSTTAQQSSTPVFGTTMSQPSQQTNHVTFAQPSTYINTDQNSNTTQHSNNMSQNTTNLSSIPLSFTSKSVNEIIHNLKKKLHENIESFRLKAKEVFEVDEKIIKARNNYLIVVDQLNKEESYLNEIEENIDFFNKVIDEQISKTGGKSQTHGNSNIYEVVDEVEKLCDDFNKIVEANDNSYKYVKENLSIIEYLNTRMK